MCGTSTVGNASTMPVKPASTTTTSVGGAAGGPEAKGGGGATTDIKAILEQVAKSIEALSQALTGSTAVAGAAGGGAASTAESMSGATDAQHGAGGCGMSGCGGDASTTGSGGSSDTAGESGSGSGDGTDVAGGGAPGKPGPDVGGADGDGDKPADKPDSGVAGTDGPGGKPGDVGGTDGGGDVTQLTPVQQAQAKLDAATTDAKAKADAVTAAKDAVTQKTGDVTTARAGVTKAVNRREAAERKLENAEKALDTARTEKASYTAKAGDTFASVAAQYGITVAKLKNLNPDVTQNSNGKLNAGTVLKVPNDAGIAAAANKVEAAKAGLTTAQKGVTDALAALKAAEDALAAANEAVKAAKDAAKKAEEAVKAAQKALDEAKAAAGTEGGGNVEQVTPTKAQVIEKGAGKSVWDKANSNVKVTLFGKDFSFDPVSLRKPEIRNGRAHWEYKERTETFEIDGKQYAVTFKPSFSIKEAELAADGSVKSGVEPKVGLEVLSVKPA